MFSKIVSQKAQVQDFRLFTYYRFTHFFPSVYVSISSVQMFLLFLSNTDTTDSDMQKNLLKAHKAQLNSATDALNQCSCTAVQK